MQLEVAGRKVEALQAGSIEFGVTIEQAANLQRRLNVEAFFVEQAGVLKGILTGLGIERAIQHRFNQAGVEHFMIEVGPVVGPNTTLTEIEEILTTEGMESVPIVDSQNRRVGIVSRSQLARACFAFDPAEETGRFPLSPKMVPLNQLLGQLSKDTYWLLTEIGTTAAQLNMVAYLVGGSIRDLLLGKDSFDLDFVVEGNAVELACVLEQKFSQEIIMVAQHERFQTATLKMKSNTALEFDLATARTEFYEYPAALPVVAASDLKSDLLRRDFTINTLAVCLNPGKNDVLIDYFGGYDDIKNGVVRILHAFSFIEDPTRLIRAVRFAARFNFAIEAETAVRAKQALYLGVFDHVGGTRLKTELKLMLALPCRMKALSLLCDLGIFLSRIKLDKSSASRKARSMYRAQLWLQRHHGAHEWLIYCGILTNHLLPEQLDQLLDELYFTGAEKAAVVSGANLASSKLPLSQQAKRSEIYHCLNVYSEPALIMAMCSLPAGSPTSKFIRLYLIELRKTKIYLSGDDLISLGIPQGPTVGKLLQNLMDARLDQQIVSKQQELNLVKEFLNQKRC